VTPIEDLVRQALTETPTAVPTTTDPLAALDRRVRRARRWLAAGAGAVTAAIVAAVVVPLALLGGNGSPNSLVVQHSPTPAPSNPPGVTTWWPSGAESVAGPYPRNGAPLWVLIKDTDTTVIGPVNPNEMSESYPVSEPADYVVPAQGVEWVVGTDHGSNTVRVTALDNGSNGVSTLTVSGSVVNTPTAVGDSLYLLTSEASSTFVRHFVLSNDGIDQSQPLVLDGATKIAATSKGHVWVQGRQKLYEVITTGNAVREDSAVDWSGDIYGPTGVNSNGDDLWAYDGDRLIDLLPKNLLSCVSCAEGWRINVAARPTAVVTGEDGSLFVATTTGIYFYSAQDVHGSGTYGAPLPVSGVTSMAADPSGGVDYVTPQGELDHWDPQGATASR